MRTHTHRLLDAVGPIVERLAIIAAAREFGDITEDEYLTLRGLYLLEWNTASVK